MPTEAFYVLVGMKEAIGCMHLLASGLIFPSAITLSLSSYRSRANTEISSGVDVWTQRAWASSSWDVDTVVSVGVDVFAAIVWCALANSCSCRLASCSRCVPSIRPILTGVTASQEIFNRESIAGVIAAYP
jgi:hypothetical protein